MTLRRPPAPGEEPAEDQPLDVGPPEARDRIFGRTDDRLIHVERRVQQDRDRGFSLEGLKELTEPRVRVLVHGLNASRSVYVNHGGDEPLRRRQNGEGELHEGGGPGRLKVVRGSLLQYCRREGAKRFSELHLGVDQFSHILPSRVRQQAAISQSARPPFHSTLIPEDQPAARQFGRHAGTEIVFFEGLPKQSGMIQRPAALRLRKLGPEVSLPHHLAGRGRSPAIGKPEGDRKSTRLNSSHQLISYAVFCLKKKKK